MTEIKISNYFSMKIQDFYDTLSEEHRYYRHIGVRYVYNNEKEKMEKVPTDEHNDWSLDKVQLNKGNPSRNYLSLYLKHIPDLYVIDFDTKHLDDCDLINMLDDKKCCLTKTKKGYHYYVYIKNVPTYSNQQKVLKQDYDVDLIKQNNIWEDKTRSLFGNKLLTFQWEELRQYFDETKMSIDNSLPVTPVQSEEEQVEVSTNLPKCNEEDFEEWINSFKPRYDYDSWLKVGIVCYNNFDGSDIGLNFWNKYSQDDEDNYCGKKSLRKKYDTFTDTRDKKLSYRLFQKWNAIDFPSKNPFETWYKQGLDVLVENMNGFCMFYTNAGRIIYTPLGSEDYELEKAESVRNYFKKYIFYIQDGDKKKKINPFDVWMESIQRRDIFKIVFNPKLNSPNNHFNVFKGFDYSCTGQPNMNEVQPFLDHIFNIWSDGNEKTYNYILNWFSRIIQQPYNKNNICLVLKSVEGVGKSIVLNLIGKIIGDKYYKSTSNLKNILGDFNSQAEGNILINLNESFYAGDKKIIGSFKEFITDETIVINRKGTNQYTIENYANTIITTNEDWIVAIDSNDRRFNILECRNEKKDSEYYQRIADTDIQQLANYFYNRDISGYNPKDFEKSQLHKEQVELNMDSTETFWQRCIEKDILFYGAWCDDYEEEYIEKADVYEKYIESVKGSFECKMKNNSFWRKMRKMCPSMKLRNADRNHKADVCFPPYEKAVEEFNTYMKI